MFPHKSLKETLQNLGIARCHLKQLPSYLADFNKLKYIDARDNNISTVNDDLKLLIKSNRVESYFSGNPACDTDNNIDCKLVCSKYCWSMNELNNDRCEPQCNSKECEYDGGDCL